MIVLVARECLSRENPHLLGKTNGCASGCWKVAGVPPFFVGEMGGGVRNEELGMRN